MDATPKPFFDHLNELRKRLILSFVCFMLLSGVCYIFSDLIFTFLVSPLANIFQNNHLERRLIYTGLTEAFVTYLKVSMFGGAFLAFPFIANQIWKFIAPGLYAHEKKVFLPFLIATPLLFIMGAAFAYNFVFPAAYSFFISFETQGFTNEALSQFLNIQQTKTLPIQLEARVSEYLSFVMRLIMAFGISFELPILLTLLSTIGVVSSKGLIQKWRIAVVAIFTVAAFITPPDVLSMIGLALPLVALYGVSIILVKFMEKRKNPNVPAINNENNAD